MNPNDDKFIWPFALGVASGFLLMLVVVVLAFIIFATA
jgi:hypothetical protein